jgi:RNA polymerase sigma-70 factor (ECF subfamily)
VVWCLINKGGGFRRWEECIPFVDAVKDLVRKAQNGDLVAFEKLVNVYQQRIYSLSYQLSGNHTDAQDLAQEAFIKAFRALAGFRNESDFGTWLHRITVNLWLNIKRKQNVVPMVSLDEPVPTQDGKVFRELTTTSGNPEQYLEDKEFCRLLRKSLDEMSPEHKAVLVLRDIEGHSYEEMAGILGCSLGTIKSRLNRARQILRKQVNLHMQIVDGISGSQAKIGSPGVKGWRSWKAMKPVQEGEGR